MHELTLHLDPATRQSLDDLADASGSRPEDLVREAVRKYLDDETRRVRSVGERLEAVHAGLLRRLGE